MRRVDYYKWLLLVFGAAMFTLGIIIVSRREQLIIPLAQISAAALFIHAARNLFGFFAHGGRLGQKRRKSKLITAVVNIVIAVIMASLPELTFTLAIYLLAVYLLFNGISKLFSFILVKVEHQPLHYLDLIAFVFYLTFAILLHVNSTRSAAFLIILGIYCILFGAEMISDFVTLVIPQRVKNDLKRHIRLSLPVFVSTFLPLGTLRYINEYISVNDRLPEQMTGEPADGEPPDIEIMVHVSNDGSGRIGHLDLYFGGEVISYGNYDRSSQRMFGLLGSGTLFISDKYRYIRFSVEHDRQMMFCYGLRLTAEQKQAVQHEVDRVKALTYEWKPPYQEAFEEKGEYGAKFSDFTDYASAVWNGTHAHFYKFTGGKFRIYSILSTNCVLLTDSILGKAGTDIVCITGVASPGIYYDYLERLYNTDRTMVISKTIYDKNTMINKN